MKKEKQVRSYKRRTKSGKTVTVRAHTAKYEAADKAKEVSKKEGAGKELEERRKKPTQLEISFGKEEEKKVLDGVKETVEKESAKKPSEKKTTKKVRPVGSGTNGPEPKKKSNMRVAKTETAKPASSEPTFTAAEFKEWYNGTGSAADKKVAKALRAQLGRSGYRKLEDEAIDNYSSRGHLSMFKRVGGTTTTAPASGGSKKGVDGKSMPEEHGKFPIRGLSSIHKSGAGKSTDAFVDKVLAKKKELPKLRDVPTSLAHHYAYAFAGSNVSLAKPSNQGNARTVLERIPDKDYNKLFQAFSKEKDRFKEERRVQRQKDRDSRESRERDERMWYRVHGYK